MAISAIKRKTKNFFFNIINFDFPSWHQYEHDNWDLIDAIMHAYIFTYQIKGVWANSTQYDVDDRVVDNEFGQIFRCVVPNVSPASNTFEDYRLANPSHWAPESNSFLNRGVWTPATEYSFNEFVVSGSKFAICTASHVSSADFDADVADGVWEVLIDVGTTVSSVYVDNADDALEASLLAAIEVVQNELDAYIASNDSTFATAIAAINTTTAGLNTRLGTAEGEIDVIQADSWVTTDRLANVNVTTGKLADLAVTTAKLANDAITEAKIANAAVQPEHLHATTYTALMPVGSPIPWLMPTIPTGYFELNGQAISRTGYPVLFAIFGTAYGVGNGTTTFNLPNLNDDVLVGRGGGLTFNTAPGASGGAATHALTPNEGPSHEHGAGELYTDWEADHGHVYRREIPGGGTGTGFVTTTTGAGAANCGPRTETSTLSNIDALLGGGGAHDHAVLGTTAHAGGGAAHNNVQPSTTVIWIVRAL